MEKKQQRNSLITQFIKKFRSRRITKPNNITATLSSKNNSIKDMINKSRHWDGFIRQKAIQWLANSEYPDVISILIPRCNDWVQEVRRTAKKSILELTTTKNAQNFINALPDIYHLKNCGRENHDDFIQTIEQFLISDDINRHLITGLSNKNSVISKQCFSLIMKNKLLDDRQLLKLGLTSHNVSVRLKSCHLINNINKKDQQDPLNIAINDKFMPVRRSALQQLINNGLYDHSLKTFLFDKHISIRRVAINNLSHLNIEKIYLDHLNSQSIPEVCYSLWGLGELKYTQEIELIKSLLTSRSPSIRRYALTCITKLIDTGAENILKNHLTDESPKIVKETSRLAAKIDMQLSADEFATLFKSSPHNKSTKTYTSIINRMNKWERLILFLRLMHKDFKISTTSIENGINQWHENFNRKLTQPSNIQIETLIQLFEKYRHLLDNQVCRSIQFTMTSYTSISPPIDV